LVLAVLGLDLFRSQTRGADKIRPPMIVRLGFVFFPLIHRRSANQENPLGFRAVSGEPGACQAEDDETKDKQAFHLEETIYATRENLQVKA
jgi:hypothetical protein